MTTGERRVLVTNDDGISSPGLRILVERLAAEVGRVVVVAPDREQSGASHALTLQHPLRITEIDDGWYSVDGTPTDCVNLAFFQLMEEPPDVVVSGINAGYNLGEDVTYSGTVAGALEGRILGAPSLAVSAERSATPEQLELTAGIAAHLATFVIERGLSGDGFLNVNVPPGARGYRVTRQGRRGDRSGVVTRRDPKGREYHWIGIAATDWRADPRADHSAVREGLVSVTPLHSDLTFHRAIPDIEGWELPAETVP